MSSLKRNNSYYQPIVLGPEHGVIIMSINWDKTFEWTDSFGDFKFTMAEYAKPIIESYGYNTFDIFGKTTAKKYLHNQYGPAVVGLKDNSKQFWFNGKQMTAQESEKFSHDITYNNKFLEDLLKE